MNTQTNPDKRTAEMMEQVKQLSTFQLWIFTKALNALLFWQHVRSWYRYGFLR